MNTPKPPLESKVVKRILERLRSRGGFWIKLHGTPFMIAGLPDIIGCYLGHFVAFEVKRGPDIPAKKIQEFYLRKISEAGGTTSLIYSPEQALERIRGLEEA